MNQKEYVIPGLNVRATKQQLEDATRFIRQQEDAEQAAAEAVRIQTGDVIRVVKHRPTSKTCYVGDIGLALRIPDLLYTIYSAQNQGWSLIRVSPRTVADDSPVAGGHLFGSGPDDCYEKVSPGERVTFIQGRG